jgi:hypothetical protein
VQTTTGPILHILTEGRKLLEKQLGVYGFWLGLVFGVVGTVARGLAAMGILIHAAQPGSLAISYNTFYHGAELLFLMAIASAGVVWLKKN